MLPLMSMVRTVTRVGTEAACPMGFAVAGTTWPSMATLTVAGSMTAPVVGFWSPNTTAR